MIKQDDVLKNLRNILNIDGFELSKTMLKMDIAAIIWANEKNGSYSYLKEILIQIIPNLDHQTLSTLIDIYFVPNKYAYKLAATVGIENIKSRSYLKQIVMESYTIYLMAKYKYPNEAAKNLKANVRDLISIQFDDLDRYIEMPICRYSNNYQSIEYVKEIINEHQESVEKLHKAALFEYQRKYPLTKPLLNEQKNLLQKVTSVDKEKEYQNKISTLELIIEQKNEQIEELKETNEYFKRLYQEALTVSNKMAEERLKKLIENLTSSEYGNILDKFYLYNKNGLIDVVEMLHLIKNFLSILRMFNIHAKDDLIYEDVELNLRDIGTSYRVDKIPDDKTKTFKARIIYPAWYLNNKEIIKPLVEII